MILRRLRPVVMTAAVLAAEVGAVAVLHRLGSVEGLAVRWDDIGGWLAETTADDAVVALVRLVAVVLAWWLLASTALYLAASVLRLRGLVHGLRWATLPGVRRLVDGIVAGSIVAGSTLTGGPAFAQAPPAPDHAYEPRPAGDMPAYTPMPAGDAPATTAATTSTTTMAASAGPTTAPPSASQPGAARPIEASTPLISARTYRVDAGDNLWTVAERHLTDTTGRSVDNVSHEELRAYWLRLVEANRDRLASGDPDLIYPSEVLVLPDVVEK